MRLEDIVNAIKLQISASVLPETRWILTLVYTSIVLLLILRICIGEPIRNLLFDQGPNNVQGDLYEQEYYVVHNANVPMRLLALFTTITMNMLPLFLPLFIGSIVNRIHGPQQNQERVD